MRWLDPAAPGLPPVLPLPAESWRGEGDPPLGAAVGAGCQETPYCGSQREKPEKAARRPSRGSPGGSLPATTPSPPRVRSVCLLFLAAS